ncbi:MAG: hypothetical protein WCS95_05890 [Lentisphaeria bacterium]|jgi:hypothetical protein|nr:hypothetical protein [Lentisphaeria bacterium]NLZ60969.1 hypothetical protein [Lentisphaerota bacterium]
MQDYEFERWFRLLRFANHYGFGSLWWLDEEYLKQSYPGYDQNSQRQGHPGLSLRKGELKRLDDVIPMLIGSSRKRGPAFEVSDVVNEQPTYFRALRPLQVLPKDFLAKEGGEPALQRNVRKPKLNPAEKEKLKKFIFRWSHQI